MNSILNNPSLLTLTGIFMILSLVDIICILIKKRSPYARYLNYVWVFFLLFLISEFFSFYIASWGWGILSFLALREYFSLVDLRLQDRLGILASYFSIPFMMHFVHTDWYGMFIVSIPVYSFIVIPFLIAISGKQAEGAITSVGIIVYGLFLFVFCIGHLAYLAYFSTWMAVMLILNIVLCDSVAIAVNRWERRFWMNGFKKYFLSAPFVVVLTLVLSGWTGFGGKPAFFLGLVIPLFVIMGNHTVRYFESDLGIQRDELRPGRGLIMDNIKSVLYTTPIVFHYVRYFSDIF